MATLFVSKKSITDWNCSLVMVKTALSVERIKARTLKNCAQRLELIAKEMRKVTVRPSRSLKGYYDAA